MSLTVFSLIQRLTCFSMAIYTCVLASKENVLHNKLFENYNKHVRPVHRQNTTVEIIIHMFSGFSIDDVDLLRGTVGGNVWLEVKWKDQFLSWNSSDYDDVQYIIVDSKDVWLPDLLLFSKFEKGKVYRLNPDSIGRALVWSDGIVRIYPIYYMYVAFDASVYKFPFDAIECLFQIGSRYYTNNLVSIKFSAETEAVVKQTSQANGQWEIVNERVENITVKGGILDLTLYYFTLKRKWLYYVLNIMAPVAITSALNILCFTLPSDSGERITLCISVYLTLAVFLSVVNNALPETSDEQSILSIYIGLQFVGSTFTIMMTVITIKLYHHEGELSYSSMCAGILDKVRKRKPKCQTEIAEGENCATQNETVATTNHGSWKRLSYSLNIVCFYLLVAWNIGLIIAFIVVVRS